LDGFGRFSRAETVAAAAAIAYVEKTQFGDRPPLDPPSRDGDTGRMLIDPAPRANLGLMRTLAGEKAGSRPAGIGRTGQGAGRPLVASRLAGPLTGPVEIRRRQDSVAFLVEDTLLRQRLRERLKATPDIARALSRLAMQ